LNLLDGVDPIDAKRAAKAAKALAAAKTVTFAAAFQQYYNAHEAGWKSKKHRSQFKNSIKNYAIPVIGKLAVADVDTGQVLKVIEPLWQTKTETASRVRSRIEQILDWCGVRGYRSGENPARWRGHLEHLLPARGKIQKTVHHAALPYGELPALMLALTAQEGVAAKALQFTILTAARTGEVLGATWDEIDFGNALWKIPGVRMKNGKPHTQPLSDRALEILRGLPRETDNAAVFIGSNRAHVSSSAMPRLLERMGRTDIVVHGFRASFKTWAGERTRFASEIIEMSLAHTVGNAVEQAYQRSELLDKRRRLMQAWATYCSTRPADAAKEDTVVAMRKAT
jgi:integrase